jgi:hypothetical protein
MHLPDSFPFTFQRRTQSQLRADFIQAMAPVQGERSSSDEQGLCRLTQSRHPVAPP